jgi:membrane protein DedA with SNARE-associated domain
MIGMLARLASDDSTHKLPGLFNKFSGTLDHYGYAAVILFLVVENLGVPLPGQLVLIAAALYAANGGLNIVVVGLVGIAASVTGSALGYAIGLYGGRPLAERFGKYVFLTPERLDKTENFFAKRGWLVALFGRFVDGVRQATGIIAGISDMTFKRFMIFTTAGAVIWVGVWTTVGDLAGDHITTISKYAGYAAAVLGVLAVLFIARAALASRRRKHALAGAAAEAEPEQSANR